MNQTTTGFTIGLVCGTLLGLVIGYLSGRDRLLALLREAYYADCGDFGKELHDRIGRAVGAEP